MTKEYVGVQLIRQRLVRRTRRGRRKTIHVYRLRWRDEDGRVRTETLGVVGELSKTDAETMRRKKAVQFDKNPTRRSRDRSVTVKSWCSEFMERKRSDDGRPGTVKQYQQVADELTDFFGAKRIVSVSVADARAFRSHLARGSRSKATVDKLMRHTRAVFEAAVHDESEILDRNSFRSVRIDLPPAADWRFVPAEEYGKVQAALPAPYRLLAGLARFAALRRSDALALRWQDVDGERHVLRFTQAKTGIHVEVPINPDLADGLDEIRAAGPQLDRVVPQSWRRDDARHVHPRYICEVIRAGFDAAGIPPPAKPLHDLRKSCVQDWANRRYPVTTVQSWAGHACVQTTLKFYTQVSRHDLAEVQSTRLVHQKVQTDAQTA